jgi:hypothetical protein
MFSPALDKALNLINFERGDPRGPATPPQKRTEYAARVAGVMVPETARSVYSELLALRSGHLFKDEADLLDALAVRLEKPVDWRHSPDFYEVKEGRK